MRRLYKRKDNPIELNLTSIMDMFTILLFFFLTTYSFEGVLMKIEEGIELPVSKSRLPVAEKYYMAISMDKVTIDGIVYNSNGRDDVLILSHLKELKKRGANFIIIQADRSLPFYKIRNYIRIIVQAGFSKPFLAVLPE
jgi:biopolymer transport protein ExbD